MRRVSWLLVLLLLPGCTTLLNIENPDYSIRSITPRVSMAIPLSSSFIDFDIAIGIDNPNTIGITLDEIDFDLFVNGSQIVRAISAQDVRIPARGFGTVQMSTRVDYQSLRSLFQEVADIVRGERARYELRGTAYYRTPLGRMGLPFTIYGDQSTRF
jgi:LEA14-like dessication related protein